MAVTNLLGKNQIEETKHFLLNFKFKYHDSGKLKDGREMIELGKKRTLPGIQIEWT